MGSIDSKKRNGKYRARYRDPDGRQLTAHFERKADAENWLTSKEASILDGTYVDPAGGRIIFKDYASAWADRQTHAPTTREQVASHLKNHVLPTFGHRSLNSIQRSQVQAWVRGLQEKLAPATVEIVYGRLAGIFKSAIDDSLLVRTPCRSIKMPRANKKLVVPMSTDQVMAVVDAVHPHYRALVVVAATAGLRQGEIFGLQVSSLDLLRRYLHVDKQVVLVTGRPPELAPLKTSSSVRSIPIPELLAEELARHLAKFGPGEHELVFTDEQGRTLRRNRFSEAVWDPVQKALGIPKGSGLHELRHYYASLLIRHGESVKTVQHRLGHKSAMETLDTYGHLWPDSEERTREAVEQEWMRANFQQSEDSVRTGRGLTG